MARAAAIVLAVLAIVSAVCYWALTRTYTHQAKVSVELPREIGGTATADVDVAVRLHPADLAASSDIRVGVTPDDFDHLLPDKEFSLLAAATTSDTVASMLGRMAFVAGSGGASVDGPTLAIMAGLTGEFYVRAKRDYGVDEEQPDTGEALDFSGEISVVLVSVVLNDDWTVRIGARDISFKLEPETRDSWRGRYGEGDHLAELVEGLLDERASTMLDRIEVEGQSLRQQLTELADGWGHRALGDRFAHIRVTSLETDPCLAGGADGSISIGMGGRIEYLAERHDEFSLPDLSVRDRPCGASAH